MARATPVDELVGLLSRWSPASLDELRAKYPAHDKLLKTGIVAGVLDEDVVVRVEICLAGLQAAVDACLSTITQLKRKLKSANTLQFAGQLATIVAGASIFGVLAVNVPNVARYAAAFLALAGSVLTFIAQHALRAAGGKDANVLDIYSELVDCRVNAEATLQDLEIARNAASQANVSDLVKSANVLAARVKKLISIALV